MGKYLIQSYEKIPYSNKKQKTKSNIATQKRHQKLQFHNNSGPT